MNVRAALRPAALILGSGYVLFFFSERVFWSFWHADDTALSMIGGWLVYAVFAYLVLSVVRVFRVRRLAAQIMVGALFGWLVEGTYAMTLYGDPSMPFPLTLAWTGLAWHALLSVVIGLFGLRHCLQAASITPALLAAIGLGAFWGLWASGWAAETPPLVVSPAAFFLHAAGTTGALAVAQWGITAGRPEDFSPSRLGRGAAAASLAIVFMFVAVPAVPWAPLVLLPLLGLLYLALRRHRRTARDPDLLRAMARPIRARNLVAIPLLAGVATAAYAGLAPVGPENPAHQVIAAVAMLVASAAFAIALLRLGMTRLPSSELPSSARP